MAFLYLASRHPSGCNRRVQSQRRLTQRLPDCIKQSRKTNGSVCDDSQSAADTVLLVRILFYGHWSQVHRSPHQLHYRHCVLCRRHGALHKGRCHVFSICARNGNVCCLRVRFVCVAETNAPPRAGLAVPNLATGLFGAPKRNLDSGRDLGDTGDARHVHCRAILARGRVRWNGHAREWLQVRTQLPDVRTKVSNVQRRIVEQSTNCLLVRLECPVRLRRG